LKKDQKVVIESNCDLLKKQLINSTSLKQAFNAQVEQLNHISNRLDNDGTRLNNISHIVYGQAATLSQMLNVIKFQDESIKKLSSRFNSQFTKLNEVTNILANQTNLLKDVYKIVAKLDHENYYPIEDTENLTSTLLKVNFEQHSSMCKLEKIFETNDDMYRPLIVSRNDEIIRGSNKSVQVKLKISIFNSKYFKAYTYLQIDPESGHFSLKKNS